MKTGNKVLSIIAWLPAIFMIVFIFALSSQDGDASYYTSSEVAKQVTRDEIISDDLNSLMRAVAHVGEYAVFSLFTGLALTVNGIRGKMRTIYMILLSSIVSVLDEFYQIFIPGRYGDLKDIFSDIAGASLIAVLLYLLTFKAYKKKLSYDDSKVRHMFGININNVTKEAALELIFETAEKKESNYVVTPNVDHIVKLCKYKNFRDYYKDAALCFTDGAPLMWIGESLGHPIIQRLAGSDLLPVCCEKAASKGKTVFLLGAMEGVAEEAAAILKTKYPELMIVGTYSPKAGFEENEEELNKIFDMINETVPDILVLGLGTPKQERFIYKNRNKMKFGIALCFGAAIDFVAGKATRAPEWMRKYGLEWFYRFMQEPGRMFRRYFIDDIQIFYYTYKNRLSIINQSEHEDIN